MRRMKITAKVLRDMRACDPQIRVFRRVFPSGVVVYDDQEKNFPIVAEASNRGLSIGWFLEESGYGCLCTVCHPAAYRNSKIYVDEFFAAGLLADLVSTVAAGKSKRYGERATAILKECIL